MPRNSGVSGVSGSLWEGLLCIGAGVAASYLNRTRPEPLSTIVGALLSTQYYRGISCDLVAQRSAAGLVLACSVADRKDCSDARQAGIYQVPSYLAT